jgi:hypothetical protein
MHELPLPGHTRTAKSANEILRVWVCDGRPTFVLASGIWSDPAAWGVLAADLMRHAAASISTGEQDRVVALQRIKEGFDAEWAESTE